MFLVISVGSVVLAAALLVLCTHPARATQELSQAQLVEKVESNLLAKVQIRLPSMASQPAEIRGTFYPTDATGQVLMERGLRREVPFHAQVKLTPQLESKLLHTQTNLSVVTLNPYVEKANQWLRSLPTK